ncbi:MAG: TIR domain-containing protein [Clostridiales bacterium]|nr:TIR domain-containing protein [Clostridiales bacterium]
MSEMRDLFISYSNANKEKVEEIVSTIKYFGPTCWFQLRDSKQHFIEEINAGINNSRDFVVFLSNASVSSLMVRNEIARAISQQKRNSDYSIIPVVIEELTESNQEIIELFLGSLNWLYADKYDNYEGLALAIFEQANLTPSNTESGQSIYSTEKEVEKIRLKAQNKFFNEYAKQYLDEVFSHYENPAVLDIGCDTGDNIMMRLNGRKYRFLLGVDSNTDAVKEANESYPQDNCAFIHCDVTSNSFFRDIFSQMQKFRIIGFDIIHISAVLLHLGKVEELLSNLYMLLNAHGTIFIQDEDDGMNIAHPHSKYFDDCFYIWEHSKESGDRAMGRKLPLLLKHAGFKDIKLLSSTISSIDFGEQYKEELWDLYFNPELWSTDSAAYFDNYEAFDRLKVVAQKHSEMKESYLAGEYFITLGIFFYTATKD